MRNHLPSSLLLAALLATGCAGQRPVATPATASAAGLATAAAPVPAIVRPVVSAERGADELVRALGLIKEGDLPQAEANLEEIVKVRPDIPEAHFNLGWVKHQLQKYDDAVVHLAAGLQLQPNEVRAYNLLAISQRELGRFAEAEASYRKALALAPDNPRLHLNLGILYDLYLLKPDLALEQYRRYQALQAGPEPKVAGWIAVLERQGGK